jgi:phenylacetate-CoA ligase
MPRLWWPFATNWPSAERIREYRERKLRRLVRHAATRVPFYRDRFRAAGVDPESVRTVADLSALPLTSKEELQSVPREARVTEGVDFDRLVRRRTSGSTASPLSIFRTPGEERRLGLLRFRALRSMGMRIRDRRVGLEYVRTGRGSGGIVPGWMQKLGVLPRTKIDCTRSPDDALAALRETRADIVGGYASFLHLLAGMTGPGGLADLGVRMVTSTGEVLTGPMRASIRECFRAPVLDTYATLECNLIAWECAETHLYHLMDHSVVTEVLRDGRPAAPGQRGEVVITPLHPLAGPFLRYRLDDLVTRGPDRCPCGAPFATVREIAGRMNDMLVRPDGSVFHSGALKVVLNEQARWALRFQILQDAPDHIRVRLRPGRDPAPDEVEALRRALADALGPGTKVEVHVVDDLPSDPSGKLRVVRSALRPVYDTLDWETLDDGRSTTGARRRALDDGR